MSVRSVGSSTTSSSAELQQKLKTDQKTLAKDEADKASQVTLSADEAKVASDQQAISKAFPNHAKAGKSDAAHAAKSSENASSPQTATPASTEGSASVSSSGGIDVSV